MNLQPVQSRSRLPLTAVAAGLFGVSELVACGSSDDAITDTIAAGFATAGGVAAEADTAAPIATAAPVNSAGPTTVAAPAEPVLIRAVVAGGEVTTDSGRHIIDLGDEVSNLVETDLAEPVHLHGYDIEADAAPGIPAAIDFTADLPGVFEVELEDSAILLFEIEVS